LAEERRIAIRKLLRRRLPTQHGGSIPLSARAWTVQGLRVSASIGVVVAAVAGKQAEALLDAADRGLYRTKTRGKDQWALHVLDTQADG
jgi:GGDEF domain-containing protein